MSNELSDFHHDVSFDCRSDGEEYRCEVEGYTENGDQISTTLNGVTTIRGEGDVKHSTSYGRPEFKMWQDHGDTPCFYDPSYGGTIVYCDPYHV